MSLSYLERSPFPSMIGRALVCTALAGLCTAVQAAENYWVPSASLSAVRHSDIWLNNAADGSVNGMLASVQTILGVRNPRSSTELRPRLEFENYNGRPELRHTNAYVDLNNRYESPLNLWELTGGFTRESSYMAQRTNATYDPFKTDDQTVDATGRVSLLSETYTRTEIRPAYTHRLSERLGVNFGLSYQKVDFSGVRISANSVDYEDHSANAGLNWAASARTRLGAGAYTTAYRADDRSNKTTGSGLTFWVEQHWSEKFTANADLFVERTRVQLTSPVQDKKFNSWALNFGVVRQGEVGNLRANVGRFFAPSTGGARVTSDQVRLQYDRRFRQLWSYVVAVRGLRNREQGVTLRSDDRDYEIAQISLLRDLTPAWHVSGQYAYSHQKYLNSNVTGRDNQFMLTVGYTGLGPR